MYPYDKDNIIRKFAVKYLFPLFMKTSLTANQITLLNFFVVGMIVVVLFATGHELIGLLLSLLCAMIDYVDGSVARAGRGHPKGQYLDTSLDWLYLMLVICAISYYHKIMLIGYLSLVSITFGNWVQYNGNVNIKLPYFMTCECILIISILLRRAELGITAILFIQSVRTALMYRRSIWNT